MATADDIPTDLALEIGADFEPKKFVAAAREFFGLVDAVADAPAAVPKMEWRVKVREGSSILALDPAPTMLNTDVRAAYARVDRATKALVAGDFTTVTLGDKALEHARKLSDLAKGKDGTIPMRIWVNRHATLFGPDVGEFIREETRPAYYDFGSVEGTLNAIQDASGQIEVRIRDALWPRPIKCLVPESMLSEVMATFRERVELFGEIHYRKDDSPESIRVERLERLPSDDDLPSIDDVRGLFGEGPVAA